MSRNKTPFYTASYVGTHEITDEYGNLTGQYEIIYSNPIRLFANISSARGEMQSRQFGEGESYDRVIVMDNAITGINEFSILWIDTFPELETNGSLSLTDDGAIKTPHDYVVKKIARSLNSVSIAVKKVDVQ